MSPTNPFRRRALTPAVVGALLLGAGSGCQSGNNEARPTQSPATMTMPPVSMSIAPTNPTGPITKHPTMTLSRARGPRGATTFVKVVDCPASSPDQLVWHDSANLVTHVPSPAPYRVVAIHRSGTGATATFKVLPADHLGKGILEVLCAGVGNATAAFVVTH